MKRPWIIGLTWGKAQTTMSPQCFAGSLTIYSFFSIVMSNPRKFRDHRIVQL